MHKEDVVKRVKIDVSMQTSTDTENENTKKRRQRMALWWGGGWYRGLRVVHLLNMKT